MPTMLDKELYIGITVTILNYKKHLRAFQNFKEEK